MTTITSKKRMLLAEKSPYVATTNMGDSCGTQARASTGGIVGSIPTLQELTGNVIRKHVEEERKDVIREYSKNYESKRIELEIRREELERQLREVEEQMRSMEIDCHKDILTALDHFDNEKQPKLLDILTDTGQLDRICPLCEQYFRSTTELPNCCLGRDRCYLHTVQRCCFSCLRPGLYDILRCLAIADNNNGNNEVIEGGGGGGILDDLISTIETAAATPSWMLDQIFGEGVGRIGHEDEDEEGKAATTVAAAAIRLVPSESGSVMCPVCQEQYCDYDFLCHFGACCRVTY